MDVLLVKDVYLLHNRKEILTGVSFSVSQGETLFLVGESGSGKTLLLKSIAGLIQPFNGSIQLSVDKLGFVFQSCALFNSLSVYENIALPLREKGRVNGAGLDSRVKSALKLCEVDELSDRIAETLSGGEKKRVAIARAIITDPQFILFDEPTSGLEWGLSVRLMELIRSLKKTSIITSHDSRLALKFADRIAILHDGKIYRIESPAKLANEGDSVIKELLG